jgi:hypothetical protein
MEVSCVCAKHCLVCNVAVRCVIWIILCP